MAAADATMARTSSDAIVVGEDWISEHYFTTDAKQSFQAKVLERRNAGDTQAEEGHDTARSRFMSARQSLLTAFAQFAEAGQRPAALADTYASLRQILGYTSAALQRKIDGPVTWVHTTGLESEPPLALIAATAVESLEALLAKGHPDRPTSAERTLLEPYEIDEKTHIFSVARLLSHLFVSNEQLEYALVMAGHFLLVAQRTRWPEGRYLAIDLQVVAERGIDKRGGETDRALACVEAASLAPDTEGTIWWSGVLEESIKHTVSVSKDLREGVRLSIEIIANEVVDRRRTQGLPPLSDDKAQDLARNSLRFLYRILFLLYAESQPDLEVLPAGTEAYDTGYGLSRLGELALQPIASPRAQNGTYLYESLATLFRMVDEGHDGAPEADDVESAEQEGLTFQSLKADLFDRNAIALIDDVQLGNAALQRVLKHLLLSKEVKGRDRGFISYAELGINQLGAVYEGLMSYRGFFAAEDLHEVAKDGNSEKGSWVVPVSRSQSIDAKDFVKVKDEITGEERPVLHHAGTFVFRLAGRERQQSASYYTPEVLTRFTVGQALEELLDQDEHRTTADEILQLTICEPALGSGAFAIEAVRQLAAEYLKRRQTETGTTIDPDEYPAELQKTKAYIALHNVYGVDLNDTAREFAEITLWLETMGRGLQAPWFGLHLRRGNSLIGARRATFRPDQLAKKAWLDAIPADKPLLDHETGGPADIAGGIHHFLLPARGWGSAVDAKEAKELAPETLKELKDWRKTVLVTPTKKQADALANLGQRAELLWDFAIRRLRIAEAHIRRRIDVWGAETLPGDDAVTREQVEKYLADAGNAYRRLRSVMDAWCALWFWPLTDSGVTVFHDVPDVKATPPNIDEWIAALQAILGVQTGPGASGRGRTWRGGDQTLLDTDSWDALGEAEQMELQFSGARSVDEVQAEHLWLKVCARVADQQAFFHWELDFGAVFAERGGFDLQVGNPPWVRPRSDVNALLAEGDPWWQLKAKSTRVEDQEHREIALAVDGLRDLVLEATADVAATAAFLGDAAHYPHLGGLQPDLYRCFMEQTWRHVSQDNPGAFHGGIVGLIHLESHFTDEKAGALRAETYRRLRRHWQFINELQLFEIQHQKRFGVHIYGRFASPNFYQAAHLYHPDTVTRSFQHDGAGPEPGIKDDYGHWDVAPHRNRITQVTGDILSGWHKLLEDSETPVLHTRMVYSVNSAASLALDRISRYRRIAEEPVFFAQGWDDVYDRRSGRFESSWGVPRSWDDAILQGSHIYVGEPLYKEPNPTLLHNTDWSPIDLEHAEDQRVPATAFQVAGSRAHYDSRFTHWEVADLQGGSTTSRTARDFYRLAWRKMAANTGARTLTPAILPRRTAHLKTLLTLAAPTLPPGDLVAISGGLMSLVADFAIRSSAKSDILYASVSRLPSMTRSPLKSELVLRTLRLNCVTAAYADLWESCWEDGFWVDGWATEDHLRGSEGVQSRSGVVELNDVGPEWSTRTPLRRASDRRRALLEIDSLVALTLGISADDLCTIYRTQFPVLRGYDQKESVYDANGRLVPLSVQRAWLRNGGNSGVFAENELSATHPGSDSRYQYATPFALLDREKDLRAAYAHFEGKLQGGLA